MINLIVAIVTLICGLADPPAPPVTQLDPPRLGFFSKHVDNAGISILAHECVDDAALRIVHDRLQMMLERMPIARANLVAAGAEVRVIGRDQLVTDMPSMRHWHGRPFDGHASIDERGRGFGGLVTLVSEESLLRLPTARHADQRDICVHEAAHMIHLFGLSADVHEAINARFAVAGDEGRWTDAYAMTNDHEFFAELSMWYFGSRGDFGAIDPPPEEGRAWLRRYDPASFDLLDSIYSGRLAGSRITWRDLVRRPPADETRLRSRSATERVTILFVNDTDRDYTLHWLDYEGLRKPYGPLPAGARLSQTTFLTHPWVVVDEADEVYGVYEPAAFGKVTVSADADAGAGTDADTGTDADPDTDTDADTDADTGPDTDRTRRRLPVLQKTLSIETTGHGHMTD
ncbi:MAG: hypothetical protein HKO59_13105, partial [Phycisphaerales bacterium]|nr:hypothetical protein [Phycisphaerales bacterium]